MRSTVGSLRLPSKILLFLIFSIHFTNSDVGVVKSEHEEKSNVVDIDERLNSTINNGGNNGQSNTKQKYFLTSFYSMVLAVGLPGNLLLIISIIGLSHTQVTRNLFLVNLALGDLINLAICIPIAITGLYVPWPFGPFVCKYVLPLTDVVIGNSVFTLLAISIERYRVIMYPMQEKVTQRALMLISLLMWILSYSLIALPLTTVLKISRGHWVGKSCNVHWSSKAHEVSYHIGIFTAVFCIPFTIITICFKRMRKRLQGNTSFALESMDLTNLQRRTIQNRRIIRLLCVIIICFATCFLPLNIMLITRCLYPDIVKWEFTGIVFQVSFLVLLCHSVINPIIMFILTKEIRYAMKKYVRRVFCCCKGFLKMQASSLRRQHMPLRKQITLTSTVAGMHRLLERE